MRKTILSLIPVAALVAAPLAFAQQPPQQPPSMQQTSKSHAKVSDATLHKFAAAYEDQMKLRTKYMTQLQNAKNDEERQSIQKEAEKEMKKAIERHMSIKQYKKVAMVVKTDPGVRQRLMEILQADRASGPAPSTA